MLNTIYNYKLKRNTTTYVCGHALKQYWLDKERKSVFLILFDIKQITTSP